MHRSIPNLEDLLTLLVRCPSVNPGGQPVAAGTGEAGMSALLEDLLRPWASEIVVAEVEPGRSNFVARFAGRDRSRCYGFEAHSDTVGIAGMTVDPFGAAVRDGRLYGRGASDTKGPMTAMLLAILRHLEKSGTPACDLLFVSTCDEELGGLGARRLVEEGMRCDGLVVGEPTSLRPIDCHKGAARFRVTVRGKAGHSAYPEMGCNAIHVAADFIRFLAEAVEELAGTASWPEPGPPTASVGVIHGGDQVNRVPDRAMLEIDFRVPPGLHSACAEETIARAASAAAGRTPGASTEIEITQRYPAFRLGDADLFREKVRFLADSEDAFGTARYATNAGFFASRGVPCIVFGPGSPGDAHTANESIALAEVEEAAKRLESFLAAL